MCRGQGAGGSRSSGRPASAPEGAQSWRDCRKEAEMEKFITRAARLNKAYDIELIERELECGEDDIIVKNHMMGICGSDKSFYRASFRPDGGVPPGRRSFPFFWAMRAAGRWQP